MNQKGKESEQIAEIHLKSKGYTILFKNKRLGRFEVDLVCEKNGFIVFVEVKSLSSSLFKSPFESVDRSKQKRIIRVADYIMNKYYPNLDCRFDIVSIIGKRESHHIEHIKSAFTPEIDV